MYRTFDSFIYPFIYIFYIFILFSITYEEEEVQVLKPHGTNDFKKMPTRRVYESFFSFFYTHQDKILFFKSRENVNSEETLLAQTAVYKPISPTVPLPTGLVSF